MLINQVVCSYMTKNGVHLSIFDKKEAERLNDFYGDTFCIHEGKTLAEVNAKLEKARDEAFTNMLNKRYNKE